MMSDNDYARRWWYLVDVAHADGVPEYQTGRPQDLFLFSPGGASVDDEEWRSHLVLFDSREYAQEVASRLGQQPARLKLGMRLEAYTTEHRGELADILDKLMEQRDVRHVTFTFSQPPGRADELVPIDLAVVGIRSH